jgi:hypothetical protein
VVRLFFDTRPEVAADPAQPAPIGPASPAGGGRIKVFATDPDLARMRAILSRAETWTLEAAALPGQALGPPPGVDPVPGEVDRNDRGRPPSADCDGAVTAFLAEPAIDPSAAKGPHRLGRPSRASSRGALAGHGPGDLVLVSHRMAGAFPRRAAKGADHPQRQAAVSGACLSGLLAGPCPDFKMVAHRPARSIMVGSL